ncbi:MAG: glycosyltransferase [Anaerolineales bacterium]|nr:glycosyltransferase [Chloroflexota bacterium]MBL6980702.1 glycosyltransferase [Anaerolineales bacterium]
MLSDNPKVSIIIPIYNEEAILSNSMEELLFQIEGWLNPDSYELVLCENGSTDDTAKIAKELTIRWASVCVEQLPIASYGHALQHGIAIARGKALVIFNADFWETGFLKKSMTLLENHDLVIGSKNTSGSSDHRPLHRRAITIGFNLLLRMLFGFRGSDTHGIKAFRSEHAKELARQCVTDAEIFDTELVLRAQRAGLRITEIPVAVEERRPTRYGLLKRVPCTIRDLFLLLKVLGIQRSNNHDGKKGKNIGST